MKYPLGPCSVIGSRNFWSCQCIHDGVCINIVFLSVRNISISAKCECRVHHVICLGLFLRTGNWLSVCFCPPKFGGVGGGGCRTHCTLFTDSFTQSHKKRLIVHILLLEVLDSSYLSFISVLIKQEKEFSPLFSSNKYEIMRRKQHKHQPFCFYIYNL